MAKKKILINTNFSLLKTGFGRAAKILLQYLYKTNKYDLVHLCAGFHENDPQLDRTPWRSIGCLPRDPNELAEINKDPRLTQLAVYGARALDKVIQQEKPDLVWLMEDPWAFDCINAPWFNKIPTILHTTLDSLPILPLAIEQASKAENYWVWSNFAEKALHKLGFPNVKTVHGPLETNKFYKLSNEKRGQLRNRNNIPQDAFIIGFVFRNQLRKSLDKLFQGYKIFRNQNAHIKNAYLLLHTHFSEPAQTSWNIPHLAQEYGINSNEILCTYVCRDCKEFEVKPFSGQDKDCPFCGCKGLSPNQENFQGKGQVTTSPGTGVNEEQLNQVYNLMDVYCHPFTSGGQELPIQEAKLTELITLVTDYSCGEEMNEDAAASLSLEFATYKDLSSNHFDKAATYPSSIAKQLLKVYSMKPEKRVEMGYKARNWVLENYSIEKIGKYIEDFIDGLPAPTYDYSNSYKIKNVNTIIPEIENDETWLKTLYKEILDIENPGDGLAYWLAEIKKGAKRQQIHDYFKNVALQENQKNQKVDFGDLLIKNNKKQLAIIQPGSIGDLVGILGILESIRSRYSSNEWNIYMITGQHYFEIFEGCEFIDKLLPFQPWMEQNFALEGIGANKGYFDISYCPFRRPQRTADYTHNGKDLVDLDFKK